MTTSYGLGRFGDRRLEKSGAALHQALVKQPGPCVRRLARGSRACQMQFFRFLHNDSVTVREMAECAAAGVAARVAGREVLAIQDTSELVFGGKKARARGFGPIGRGGALGGLCLHPVLVVEAGTGSVLGLAHIQVWNRDGGKVTARRQRPTADKESQCWLEGMAKAAEVLSQARQVTVVGDGESDIYEEFARRPAHVHLITRVAQDRRVVTEVGENTLLFAFADALPEQGRFVVNIPAAPGRKPRTAELAMRFASVHLRKPLHGAARDLPKTVRMTIVDIRETTLPAAGEAIHWRLLTSHTVESLPAARMVLDYYRQRWSVEEYFHTIKTAGFDIEAAEIEDPAGMMRFVGAVSLAAVTILQLVKARDGTTDQALEDVFDPADRPLLETLSTKLEGRTARQKNPHPRGKAAFAAWVIARLGSWDGYYGKPGPKVMRRGLYDFHRIKYGHQLGP
jgi:hypothetical protein